MTILPTKRATASGEDSKDNTGQNTNAERSGRRRDEHSNAHIDPNKTGNRRTFRRSATPETSEHALRKRFKESTKAGAGATSRRHNNGASATAQAAGRGSVSDCRDRDSNKSAHAQAGGSRADRQKNTGMRSVNVGASSSAAPNSDASSAALQGSGAPLLAPAAGPMEILDANDSSGCASSDLSSSVPAGAANAVGPALALGVQVSEPGPSAQQPHKLLQQQLQQTVDNQLLGGDGSAGAAMSLGSGCCGEDSSSDEPAAGADATGFNSEDEYTAPLPGNSATAAAAVAQGAALKEGPMTEDEWKSRDALFSRYLTELGYEVKLMTEDGACLFRAIADQVYGDQEMHYIVRSHCMDYIVKNKDFFAPYVTEDFDKYVVRKRKWNVHGNHLEIQAMSEMYNRSIEVYCYRIEPINIFSGPRIEDYEPIRLSYHRMCHYNSISNPNRPSVGVGLGLPSYHTTDLNRVRMVDAVRASDELLIEQTMLEDKLKATDWEATSEAIEEAVAHESYIQFYRDAERRIGVGAGAAPTQPGAGAGAGGSSSATVTSTVTSGMLLLEATNGGGMGGGGCGGGGSPKGSGSPKGGQMAGAMSPKSYSVPRNSPRPSSSGIKSGGQTALAKVDACASVSGTQSPKAGPSKVAALEAAEAAAEDKAMYDDYGYYEVEHERPRARGGSTNGELSEDEWNDGILAQILAESRKTYFEEMKQRNSKSGCNNGNANGPSTSH